MSTISITKPVYPLEGITEVLNTVRLPLSRRDAEFAFPGRLRSISQKLTQDNMLSVQSIGRVPAGRLTVVAIAVWDIDPVIITGPC